jgi:type VI secretion system protein ImpA
MGTPAGRGWLDLQRYVLTACGALGGAYEAVGAAVLAELRALLAAIPSLPDMSLMDDFPTANPETRTWLRDVVLAGSEASVDASGNGAERIAVVEPVARGGRGLLDRAMAEVRAGQPQRAIEMLMRQVEREKSARGRFLRHAEVASVMVEAGLVTVAQPILEQLLKDVEAHHLETWEAGDVVAQPMALLYKCLEKTDGDSSMRQDLYLRICRLDPMQAIGFAQQ